MKIDFEHLKIYTSIAKTQQIEIDAREAIANIFYIKGQGIRSHVLAEKIYKTSGATEYDDIEQNMIQGIIPQCTPAFQDALNAALKDKKL